jgi:hypothetical protein
MEFGTQMHIVASFLVSKSKPDLNNVCDRNNILNDEWSVAKLNFLFSSNPLRNGSITSYYFKCKTWNLVSTYTL